MLKKNKLRYNEYYDMQHIYDELYAQSKNGNNFYKLLEIIGSEQNICLAYRNLKSNSGSKTAGTDGMTIDDIKQLSNAEIVATVRESLSNYRPKSVRRVFIPKASIGDSVYLGQAGTTMYPASPRADMRTKVP